MMSMEHGLRDALALSRRIHTDFSRHLADSVDIICQGSRVKPPLPKFLGRGRPTNELGAGGMRLILFVWPPRGCYR